MKHFSLLYPYVFVYTIIVWDLEKWFATCICVQQSVRYDCVCTIRTFIQYSRKGKYQGKKKVCYNRVFPISEFVIFKFCCISTFLHAELNDPLLTMTYFTFQASSAKFERYIIASRIKHLIKMNTSLLCFYSMLGEACRLLLSVCTLVHLSDCVSA